VPHHSAPNRLTPCRSTPSAPVPATWLDSRSEPQPTHLAWHDSTESRRFYNSPECSDVKIKLNIPYTEGVVVHAHWIILAAGSGYFKRKYEVGIVRYHPYFTYELIFYQEATAAQLEVDEEDATVMQAAIRYLYGFEFFGRGGHGDLYVVGDYAEAGAIAEKYEIAGLSELILTAASRALDDRMSDANRLERFLYFGHISSPGSGNGEFNFAVKIIGDHFNKLRKYEFFQRLLSKEHELAVALLNRLVEQ
jgi:hypothetical protein